MARSIAARAARKAPAAPVACRPARGTCSGGEWAAARPIAVEESMKNQQRLDGKRIAILATDGVEQVELLKPRQALHEAGAQAQVVAPNSGNIQGWNHDQKGESIPVDRTLAQANPDEFDGLLLPGGVMNPDTLRTIPDAVRFVRAFAA